MAQPARSEPQPLSRQEQRTAASRQALLDAAIRVLEDVGYHDATISMIVRAARRARGTFYVHFSSKEEIYAALLTQMRHRLHESSRAIWDSHQPLLSLRKSIDLYVQSFTDDHALWLVLDGASVISAQYQRERSALRAALTTDIRKGIASAGNTRLTGLDPDLVSTILAAMLEETCATFLLYGNELSPDMITDHTTALWGRILAYEPTAN
ncbi:MAG: helix-turn-helix domain containing protein [Aeromicrobium sp.]|uniref:TetR/AcrR family transcriptional regulator n=1 Tax=Aeromicrobium sp. TaxID=1871063 RepID=UPI00262849A3|nr:TetR/AcrR family transcriptional regulator [Aeromicrobium sp.]MDF1705935.1 helix-turn-helix domain containing protein [Aeromicrobium sp.]